MKHEFMAHGQDREEQKKIALFTPDFGGGGAERMLLFLSKFFIQKGLLVDFLVVRNEGHLQHLLPAEVNLVELNCRKTVFSLPKLTLYLRKHRPSVILSTLHSPNWTATIAKILSFSRTRLVARVAIFPSGAPGEARSSDDYLNKIIYPFISMVAFSIIGISEGVTNDLVANFGVSQNKARTIHNPAFSPDIIRMAKEPVVHPWLGGKTPVLVSVGRLDTQKDFQTLLKAFALVRQNIDAKLVILGEGTERENLEKTIDKLNIGGDVHLPGYVDNPYSYMAKASAFVCSSTYEGFGNVIVEALAVDTPVVSTDCPSGPSEILENGKWGKLVPVGNHRVLANAIIDTLREEKPADLHKRARQFDMETIGNQYLKAMGF